MALIHETIEELKRENEHFFEACNKESDRGLALVAAEFFDATLERLLLARFASGLKERPKLIRPLFEGFGPLSTFSSKISVSYAIDLLQTWMASDLDLVRRIRNEFAHSLESRTFRDSKVSGIVNQFACLTKVSKHVDKLREHLVLKRGKLGLPEESRIKFELVCTRIGALLQAKVVVLESPEGPDEMKRGFMVTPEL